jgi:hypothetical protein
VEQTERNFSVSIKNQLHTFKILTMKSKIIHLCTPSDDMDHSTLAFELEADAISYCKRHDSFEQGDYGWTHIQLYPDLEKNSKVVDSLDQAHGAKINKMAWIAASNQTSGLRDLIDDLDEETWNALFPNVFKSDCFDIDDDNETKITALFDDEKYGFLAEVHHPYCTNFTFKENGDFRSCSVESWHCRISYHYGESTEELLESILKCSRQMFECFMNAAKKEREAK